MKYGPRRFRPSKNLCNSAGMPRTDPRDHFYLTRCRDCPDWHEAHPDRPLTAARHACKHASEHPGHEAYVINLYLLKVVHRYRFDALTKSEAPSDTPPF